MTIQTATGKVLGAPKPGWSSDIAKGFQEFQKLPEAERRPKNVPDASGIVDRLPPPPGGLVLRAYTRGLERTSRGEWQAIADHSRNFCGPQRNFLWLTAAEAASLVGKNTRPGTSRRIAEPIAQRVFRHHLIDNTIGLNGPWPAEHIRAGELSLTVERADASVVELRMDGSARLADDADWSKAGRKGEFSFFGKLTYQPRRQTFDRFDVVAVGHYQDPYVREYYQQVGQRKSLTLGILFELAPRDSFGYGSVPFALWEGVNSCKPGSRTIRHYFGTDPYKTPVPHDRSTTSPVPVPR